VFSFKQPSSAELAHDFMWRYVRYLPERGRIGIFNRSYYEDTLVVRVHPEILARQRLPDALMGKDIWDERFKTIRSFERHLARLYGSARELGFSCDPGRIGEVLKSAVAGQAGALLSDLVDHLRYHTSLTAAETELAICTSARASNADFQTGDTGGGQDQTQLGGRLEPLAQHAGLQRRDQQQRDRRDHQRADPFVGVAQPDHAAALIADRP